MRHYLVYVLAILAILGVAYASQQSAFKNYGTQAYVSGSIQEKVYSAQLASWMGKNMPSGLGGGEKAKK
jgi:hypothetical protein